MSQPGYLVPHINVKDYPQYIDEYGLPVFALGSEHGVEVLVATPDAKTLFCSPLWLRRSVQLDHTPNCPVDPPRPHEVGGPQIPVQGDLVHAVQG